MKGYELYLAIAYLVLGPFIGGLLAGIDRKISARLQGRVGPPITQPFHDLRKLFTRRLSPVNRLQVPLVASHLVFAVLTGFLIFWGGDILLIIFVLTLAGIFLVLAAYSTGSPYSAIGADRELIMMTAYEPMVILTLVGLFKVAGSFNFWDIASVAKPTVLFLPGIFIGLEYVLLMKLRKSPFDLSTSHHAHQELVKGATTDFSASTLGLVEIAHWFKYAYLTAFILLFFGGMPIVAGAAILVTYLLVIFIDNAFGRFKMGQAAKVVWIGTLAVGFGNVLLVYVIKYFTAYAGWFGVP